MRTYVDSALIIYTVERVPPYFTAVAARLSRPGEVLASSELGRMECLVKPIRLGDQVLIRDFEDYFTSNVAELVPLGRAVFGRAASIRAHHVSIKTPDAIHLAAAVESGCDVFLTNDQALTKFTGITVEVI
jgi:uncharacterized protein